MKKFNIYIGTLLLGGLLLGTTACEMRDELRKRVPTGTDKEGVGAFSLDLLSKETTRAASGVDNYVIQILDMEGNIVQEFDAYTQLQGENGIVELPVGTYKVRSASYSGDEEEAAVDKPYYFSEKEFAINNGEVTNVKDTCKLNSVVVNVGYNESFLNEVQDNYSITLTNGVGVLTLDKDKNGTAYFRTAATMSIVVRATTKNGTDVYKSQVMSSSDGGALKPEDKFEINLGITDTIPDTPIVPVPPVVKPGDSHFDITIDVTLNGKDVNIEIPSPDQPTPDPDPTPGPDPSYAIPTIVGDGFNIDDLLIDPTELRVNIAAEAKIQKLIVTIDSKILGPLLEKVELPESFDLANPGDLEEALKSLGLLGDKPILGQTSVIFDISEFMVVMPGLENPDDGPTIHKFHLKVIDQQGKEVSKTLSIKFTLS